MSKLTIHAGLAELKKLDQRINRAIRRGKFVGYIKGIESTEKVYGTAQTIEEFKVSAKADINSVEDLIKRRDAIKKAITISNALTKTEIGKVTMTVAEAIEMKTSIQYKKDLKRCLEYQYTEALQAIERANQSVETALNEILKNMDKDNNKRVKEFTEDYRKTSGYTIVDPMDIKKRIDTLAEEIEDFESHVDIALSVSNATTFIEIED